MYRCKTCGRTFFEDKPNGHFYFAKRCDGKLEEGNMLFVPKDMIAILKPINESQQTKEEKP